VDDNSDAMDKKQALLQRQAEAREKKREQQETQQPAKQEPIRENMVKNATQFLSHDNVKSTPLSRQVAFLQSKGLTNDEITEAFKRINGSAPSLSTPQAPSAPAPIVVQAPPPLPPPPPPPSSSPLKTIATTILITLGTIGGLNWMFNSFLLKAWKNQTEHEVPEAPQESQLSLQMTQLLQALHSQQNEIKDTLKVVNTTLAMDRNRPADQPNTRELTNAITSLKTYLENNKISSPQPTSTPNSPPKQSSTPQPTNRFSPTPTPKPDPPKPEPTNPSGYSQNFMDVVKKVQAGEPIPGIKDIDDSPLDPTAVVTPGETKSKEKPWLKRRQLRSSAKTAVQAEDLPSYLKQKPEQTSAETVETKAETPEPDFIANRSVDPSPIVEEYVEKDSTDQQPADDQEKAPQTDAQEQEKDEDE